MHIFIPLKKVKNKDYLDLMSCLLLLQLLHRYLIFLFQAYLSLLKENIS